MQSTRPNRKIKTLFSFLIIFISSINLAAADPETSKAIRKKAPKEITAEFYACTDKAENYRANLFCMNDEYTRQDARLNRIYKNLLAKLDGDAKETLIQSERSWLASHEESEALEDMIYDKNLTIRDIEMLKNKTFRICERANILDLYLFLATL
jgi:uncharacterized protein YecT (DUF1311 family)